MISDYTISQVKERAKCHEVISDFAKLTKRGSDYMCNCLFHKEKSPSLIITSSENLWKCFGCGVGGDAIEFVIKHKNFSYQQAIEYLANKYKIVIESENTKKTYTRPVWKNNTKLSDNAIKWFENVRKISQSTLIKMKITEGKEFMPHAQKELNTIQFNYFKNDELINIKYRSGDKGFKMHKDSELILYNIDSLKGASEAYICEGEGDALSLIECGLMKPGTAVLSVPNGANNKTNNLTYLDGDLNGKGIFDDIERVYIATDNDVPGRKLREDLAERLGKDRCYYVEWGDCKDANEVLVKHGIQGVIDCCSNKKEFPLEGVFTISNFSDEIDDMYVNGMDRGCSLGMGKIDSLIRFAKGYITVITGVPNFGKSDSLDQIILKLMTRHGWKVGFYSPENRPTKLHFSKLARKLIGKNWFGANKMSEQEKNLAKNYLEGKVWFIKPEKEFTIESILNHVKLLKTRKGIDCFVIDAWNRLEHKFGKGNETTYVNETLLKIDGFCELNNVHCFLVVHPAKQAKDKKTGEIEVPNLYSLSGSAHFYNITANGITIHRDMKNDITTWYVQKVKFSHWGEIGCAEFKYDRECGRYNQHNIEIGFEFKEDKTNWITNQQSQGTLEIPDSPEKVDEKRPGIFVNEEDTPF